jgi:hypothetical protein
VPVATLVFVVVAVVAIFVLNFTRFGRYVFAVGGNERAARLSGVPVTMVKVAVYAITGLVSAIAGIVHAGQFNFGSANDGTGYELTAIAAVVIGGTSLFGGAGCWSALSAVMSRAPTSLLNNINAALQLLATGAIIVLVSPSSSSVAARIGSLRRAITGRSQGRRRRRCARHRVQSGETVHAIVRDPRLRAERRRAGAMAGAARSAPSLRNAEGRQVRHRLFQEQRRTHRRTSMTN